MLQALQFDPAQGIQYSTQCHVPQHEPLCTAAHLAELPPAMQCLCSCGCCGTLSLSNQHLLQIDVGVHEKFLALWYKTRYQQQRVRSNIMILCRCMRESVP